MLNILLKPHRANLRAGGTEIQKVFAMLKLIPEAEVAGARPPLAFVLTIDTSGSMRDALNGKPKIEHAIDAARALITDTRLSAEDQLAIIQFSDDARVLLPLSALGNRQAALAVLEQLRRYEGTTRMALALEHSQQALQGLPPQVAKRVLLLTDGQASDPVECRSFADKIGSANTPLITLGIGNDYNEGLLRDLADQTQGHPHHLQNAAGLSDILEMEVGSLVREVVTGVQASVGLVKGVTLDSITRVYPSLSEVSLANHPFLLGNIASGDYTVFVLELTVQGIARPASRARLARIALTAHVPGLDRHEEAAPQELFMTFTTDDSATASVNAEVLGYVQQKNIDRMMQEAVRLAPENAGQARQTLQVALGMTRSLGNTAVTHMLQDALHELDHTGNISAGTRKTVALEGRTRTIKTGTSDALENVPSEDEIHRLTGA